MASRRGCNGSGLRALPALTQIKDAPARGSNCLQFALEQFQFDRDHQTMASPHHFPMTGKEERA
jgi:hypothetical protein